MSTRFTPEKHIGRALDAGESVELDLGLVCLAGDHNHSAVVAVDGACRNNGRSESRAALGVYFGQDYQWNRSEVLPRADATSQRAELCAGLRALQTVRDIVALEWKRSHTGGRHILKRVVIKSDSSYLVSSMTEWIYGWLGNGFKTTRVQPVQNADLFKELFECIREMSEKQNIDVQFWHVGREHNQDADRLANAALDAAPGACSLWDFWNSAARRQREAELYASERVWRWHKRLGHCHLRDLQLMVLGEATGIDVTYDQIQKEIDGRSKCSACPTSSFNWDW
ncbi:hypothetical protein PG984_007131 [Apiospora sp. TS-2023a]